MAAETATKDVKKRLTRVVRLLEEKYGPHIYPDEGPQEHLERIVFAILLAENPVTNARKAIRRLKDEFVDWNETRVATIRQLQECLSGERIEPSGVLAEKVKDLLMKTFDEVCRVSLEPLKTDGPDRARKIVAKLDCLAPHEQQYLLTGAGVEEAPPLDPATDRIGERLGIFAKDDPPQKRRKLLEAHVAASDALRFHHLMVEHGKKLCTQDDPKCAKCPAQGDCDFVRLEEARKKAEEKDKARGKKEKPERAEKAAEKVGKAEKPEKGEKAAEKGEKAAEKAEKRPAKKEKPEPKPEPKSDPRDGRKGAVKADAKGKAKAKPAAAKARAKGRRGDDEEE